MIKTLRSRNVFWLAILVWLASLFIVNPVGNFPICVVWSFGKAVQHLLVQHEFRPVPWAAMALVTNVLWGSLFCVPWGFSFTALRVSSLVAALLGVGGTYWLVRQSRQPAWFAMLAAFTLGFSPLYYALSNTFMTDVLFAVLMLFSALFLVKYLRDGADFDLVTGTVFAVLATLSRQLALAVPLAFAAALILKEGFKGRILCRALAPVVVTAGLLAGFQHWMAATGRLSALYSEKSHELANAISHPLATAPYFAFNVYASLVYLGLFLFPVLLCALMVIPAPQKKHLPGLFGGALWTMLVLMYLFRSHGGFMPLLSNIILESGFGPHAVYQPVGHAPAALPPFFWRSATCLGVLGGALLLTVAAAIVLNLILNLLKSGVRDNREITAGFLLLSTVIYLLPLLATPCFYDRYLLPAMPLLLGAISYLCPPITTVLDRRIAAISAAVFAALAISTVGGTRDWLAWNRTRWQALDQLTTNDHVKPEQIDGGFEFNGLYLYDPHFRQTDLKKNCWWVHDDTYVVTDNLAPGYGVLRGYDFSHWLPPYTGKIYILKKSGPEAAALPGDVKKGQD